MKWEKCPVKVDYTGKIVVLTGAAGGIGSRIAMLFAQNGASMLLVDKNEEMLRITREACGGTGKRSFRSAKRNSGLPMFSFIARQ